MVTSSKRSVQQEISFLYELARSPSYHSISQLLKESHNPLLLPYVINALGMLHDSRTFFPVSFILLNEPGIETEKRCLQYFVHTADPRGTEVIRQYLSEGGKLKDIAESAITQCRQPHNFEYRYLGSETNLNAAPNMTGRIEVTGEDISNNWDIIQENGRSCDAEKPQTYVVLPSKKMYIGGFINEHVDVAKGSDVLAAGEINFEYIHNQWKVIYINNRSNGYLPDFSCFNAVKEAFALSDVILPCEKFDETYPESFADRELLLRYISQ